MEITILSRNKEENEIEVQIKGETHTLMNIIKATLLEDERVETAFYDIKSLHNSVEKEPVLYMKVVEGADPVAVLKDASGKIVASLDDFGRCFENAVNKA